MGIRSTSPRRWAHFWVVVFVTMVAAPQVFAQTFEQRLLAEGAPDLAAAAKQHGDARRGAEFFFGVMACATCHGVGDRPEAVGPDLAKLDKHMTDVAVVEAVLEPSKTIAPAYASVTVITTDGLALTGVLVEETAEKLVLREASKPDEPITIAKNEIDERQTAKQSIMPSGQVNRLADRGQFLDLIRYLLEVRDGGVERARQLRPVKQAMPTVPDAPREGWPVVQRGEVEILKNEHYPRGVAMGFAGGTVLFDADRLGTAAVWTGGFVRHSPQNYFGLYWHRAGGEPDRLPLDPHPLRFQFTPDGAWQAFEPPPESDPNTGSRFDGYQVGSSAVRLEYRVRVGEWRVRVTEDVRAETRDDWQGFARRFEFHGLPAGARVALSLPQGPSWLLLDAKGDQTERAETKPGQEVRVAIAGDGTKWMVPPGEPPKAITTEAIGSEPLVMRVDLWKYRGPDNEPAAAAVTALHSHPPLIEAEFDRPSQPGLPRPTPLAKGNEISDAGQQQTTVHDVTDAAANSPVPDRDVAPGYAMESIPLPFDGCRPSDIAFSDDGMMYAIAMTEGQIWRTPTPPEGEPDRVRWKRFATGLFHPTGLEIVDGRIYVAQKPEITELIDRNGDGIADQYRTVATGWGLSTGWHEYCFGLAVDPQKNLWFALNTGNFWTHKGFVNLGRWRGSVMRVEAGTEKLDEMATGCRTPNGIATGPEGKLFFTANQGDWIQACKLAHVVPGRFYGHPETAADALPKDAFPDGRATVWLPYERSRSTSGPVCDHTGGKFGPFADQMFVGDVGYGANAGIMRVALERVDGEYQGACFRFIDGDPLGCQRMRFGPDGCLYIASLTSGLTRLRFDGTVPLAIERLEIRPGGKGFVVRLTKPLAQETHLGPDQFQVKRYHYRYSGSYGSPNVDEKPVPVETAEVSADRRAITLTFPVETHPLGMIYEIKLGTLTAEGGETMAANEAWYTVHRIP
jgi:putative heme-binding domain-containing protein